MSLIDELLEEHNKLHFALIDPDEQSPEKAAELAAMCEKAGSNAIMIGGSTGMENLDATAERIKKAIRVPLIQFPNEASSVSHNIDYIFYMSLMNGKDRKFLMGEQVKAAKTVYNIGLGAISMGYIVVSMSEEKTTVEKIADLVEITEDDIDLAIDHALAAELMGMDCVYLEAGSGADKPIPLEMIRKVKKKLDIPLIVGGGIKDGKTGKEIARAGADVVVTGTAVEKDPDTVKEIIGGVHMSRITPSE